MNANEWRKVVFSDEKKYNLDGPDVFRSTATQKEENYLTRHSGEGLIVIKEEGFASSGKLRLQFVSGRQKAADYVKMLND